MLFWSFLSKWLIGLIFALIILKIRLSVALFFKQFKADLFPHSWCIIFPQTWFFYLVWYCRCLIFSERVIMPMAVTNSHWVFSFLNFVHVILGLTSRDHWQLMILYQIASFFSVIDDKWPLHVLLGCNPRPIMIRSYRSIFLTSLLFYWWKSMNDLLKFYKKFGNIKICLNLNFFYYCV